MKGNVAEGQRVHNRQEWRQISVVCGEFGAELIIVNRHNRGVAPNESFGGRQNLNLG